MTCIVGLKDKKNGHVWMAGDSQCSDWLGHHTRPENTKKIFKHPLTGEIIMGTCGSPRLNDILRYDETLISKMELYDNSFEVNHKYMVTTYIPRLQALLKKEPDQEGFYKGDYLTYLICARENLYCIQGDYAVLDIEDYFSIGSGCAAATGSLNATKDLDMEPSKKVEKAIRAAIEEANGVGYPIYIMNTKNDEIIKIEK